MLPPGEYEGRLISLHNGTIRSILKIGKVQNIHFVGNLILSKAYKFYKDDVTVMSFINNKYGDVCTEIVS